MLSKALGAKKYQGSKTFKMVMVMVTGEKRVRNKGNKRIGKKKVTVIKGTKVMVIAGFVWRWSQWRRRS